MTEITWEEAAESAIKVLLEMERKRIELAEREGREYE